MRLVELLQLAGFRLGLWRGYRGSDLPRSLQERVSTWFIFVPDTRFDRPIPAATTFFLDNSIEVRFNHRAEARLARQRDVAAYEAMVKAACSILLVSDHVLPSFIDWCRDNECAIVVRTRRSSHPQHRPWSEVSVVGSESLDMILLGCTVRRNHYTDDLQIMQAG